MIKIKGSKGKLIIFHGNNWLYLLTIPLQVVLDLVFVYLLLRVVYTEFAHEEVAWVQVFCTFAFNVEIVCTFTCHTLINYVAICEQDQSITVGECISARLVDSAYDSFSLFLRQILQHFADLESRETIQARGRLIEEDYFWVSDELNTNSSPLPLTSRDSFLEN